MGVLRLSGQKIISHENVLKSGQYFFKNVRFSKKGLHIFYGAP